jgi:hypothetical protein
VFTCIGQGYLFHCDVGSESVERKIESVRGGEGKTKRVCESEGQGDKEWV